MANIIKSGNRKLDLNPRKIVEEVSIKTSKKGFIMKESATEPAEFLLPKIEAIHAGPTRNFNHYPADKLRGNQELKSGVYSWMHPYAKPVIYNHDTETAPSGRIQQAAYSEFTSSGRPGIIVVPKITEKSAIQSIMDGRLLTVSIGATTDSATCSICGTDIINEDFCGHWRGDTYDGRVCEWVSGNVWFDELSWVNVPADSDAMVIDRQSSIFLGETNSKESKNKESLSEYYGVPKNGNLLIVEENDKITEINKKEETNKMTEEQALELQEQNRLLTEELEKLKNKSSEDKLKEETTEEDKTDTNEESSEDKDEETETEVTTKAEKETDDEDKDEEETDKVDTESKTETEDEKKAEAEKAEVTEESTKIEELEALNESLLSQIEDLTKELKESKIEQISIYKEFKDEDAFKSFKETMMTRSMESIKDTLSDVSTTENASKNVQRKVNEVKNPLPNSEATKAVKEETKETKESTKVEDKISTQDFLVGMLKK